MMENPFDQFDAKPAAKTRTPQDFAKVYGPAAERAGKALGVDPSMLLGQWGLETGWGKSVVPGTNNLGNIKDFSGSGAAATDNMTGSRDKYRKYDSPEAFADDFASLIQRKYPGAVGAKDPLAFATALKDGGYAEDPRYVDKVVQASRMAGTKQNPVMKAVGSAVEAVVPSAQAAEANPFDQFDAAEPVASKAPPKAESGAGTKVLRAIGGALGPGQLIADAVTGGKFSRDMAGGLVRGAGSIGATLARPFESGAENAQRRAAMDAGLSEMGADTGSTAYGGGKLGAEIAGSAGAGGVVGNALRLGSRIPVVGNALAKLATTTGSAGMTAGPGGGVATNMLARVAGGSLAGGAQAGLIDPNLAGTGAVIGGVAGPAISLAGKVGGGVVGGARAIRDTVTQGGQQRIAENILRLSATNPEAAAAALARAKPLVPGSTPTAGQAAVDPGIAQLERTLVNNPATAPGLQTRYAQQRAARGAAIDEVAATGPNSGSYYDDINEGRAIFAKEDYDAARKAGIDPEIAASMEAEIASLMGRPSIKAASAEAKRLAAETGEEITDMGSVQGMDWLRKALSNQISKAKASGATEDVRAMTQTYQDLGSTLEQIAPKYAEANRNYAAMSKQINSMDVARDLEKRYTPAAAEYGQSAQESGAAYMKALKAAQDSVKKSTGREQDLGDVMSTADIYKLENVARDLARKQYSQEAGRAVGSPTAQNLISQNFIQQIMEGAGLPASAAMESTLLNTMLRPLQFAGRLAEPKVNNRLAELILDPEAAAAALKKLPPAQRNEALKLLSNAAPGASIPRIELRGMAE